jgi:hypothetical protein
MPLDFARARPLLQSCDLPKLFVEELGWEPARQTLTLRVGETEYVFAAVAEKKGFVAWLCAAPGGGIPDHAARLKLDRKLSETSYEHLIIFATADRSRQNWVWVRKETGKPLAARTHEYRCGQPGDSLLQKLEALYVSIEEEEGGDISTVVVAGRARAAFDVEKVTKKFYKDFDSHRKNFLGFIQGIPDIADRDWYASVMLNRLMFVYFIQRKGFLDGDRDYLRNRLALCQKEQGKNQFYTFYRYFLLRLFHEGFGKRRKDRAPDLEKLLGTIPYLNGGLFDVHELEREERYGKAIQIKDEAFQKIFDYFDRYQWHLDERPLRKDDEINPDVLGYIFEKYINQKQMGAYYTKEDITEYIGKSCLIPFLVDSTRAKCRVAFENPQGPTVWDLLRENPDRYIYPAVRHGCHLPLPEEVADGLDTAKPNLIARRKAWNKPAPADYALSTEIWREVVARRQRYWQVWSRLSGREANPLWVAHPPTAEQISTSSFIIHPSSFEINDFITLNLDLRQFAQDLVQNAEGPDLLTAFWQAISTITVLDPTGGSGAFIFAALNILEPLYEGCLDRMEDFIEGWGEAGKKLHPNYHKKFSDVLANVAKHPNRRYFILKSIILNNLYAVDIMEEAVEICKLRLFLKLAAQVEPDPSKDNLGIEPLPDIDFNIRAGNTLVGYATYDEVKRAITSGLDFDNAMEKIAVKAADLQQTFDKFRQLQTEGDGSVPYADKLELQKRLKVLDDELNHHLAGEYGVKVSDKAAYAKWQKSHQPFHWFIQFYGILKNGGFDVIIGNPPYVEYRTVRSTYRLQPGIYASEGAENLYAYCMERSCCLLHRSGLFGMIVPAGILGVDEAVSLRSVLLNRFNQNWCSTYAIRPSKLFDGVDQRLCIYLSQRSGDSETIIRTTRYHHWSTDERQALFSKIEYSKSFNHTRLNRIPQLGSADAASILQKLEIKWQKLAIHYYSSGKHGLLMHYHRSPRYWIRAMDFEQYFKSPTRSRSVHHFRDIYFADKKCGKFVGALLNSTLFFFWFVSVGNGRNITGTDVEQIPIGDVDASALTEAGKAFDRLMKDYDKNSFVREREDCEFQEFKPSLSKPIIDEIDTVLAKHYGFTEEELDFIINYDIKYRLRRDKEGDED